MKKCPPKNITLPFGESRTALCDLKRKTIKVNFRHVLIKPVKWYDFLSFASFLYLSAQFYSYIAIEK